MDLTFRALEYRADDGFDPVEMSFQGSTAEGWTVRRGGEAWLTVGPGYRALQTVAAGVCSTDLDRRFLPFRLPQVTGHEVLARGLDGGPLYALEINASRHARAAADRCAACRPPMERHCPHRLVLGIHDLPGGFGPFVLAPVDALLEVPTSVPMETAVLMEPLAAAFRATERVALRPGDRVAVIGPRRLGMLVIAALASRRRTDGLKISITALARREALRGTAMAAGADDFALTTAAERQRLARSFDVVIDTTASPEGFLQACELTKRELHLKSTHGQPCGGLAQATAMVVDELTLRPWTEDAEPMRTVKNECFPGASTLIVDSLAEVDRAIRPSAGSEQGLVQPLGTIYLRAGADQGGADRPAVARLLARGVTLSTSRCGDFRTTLEQLIADPELAAIGDTMITHRFSQDDLPAAFTAARSRDCLKALVTPAPPPPPDVRRT